MSETKIPSFNTKPYEVVIGNTTYTVAPKYVGTKPFLDFIKAAIKRDVEAAIHSREVKDEPAEDEEIPAKPA